MRRGGKTLTETWMLTNKGADALNIRYLTRLEIVGPALLFWSSGRALLVISPLEEPKVGDLSAAALNSRFRARSRLRKSRLEVVTPEAIDSDGTSMFCEEEWAVQLGRLHGIDRIGVSAACPVGVVQALEKEGIEAIVHREEFERLRDSKDTDELAGIRQAQQSAVIAMRMAISLISETKIERDGSLTYSGNPLSSETVVREVGQLLLRHDCTGGSTVVCGAPGYTEDRLLQAHRPIVIDIFPRNLDSGYWGDLARTVVRGTASPRTRRAYAAVKAAQGAALAKLRPGVRGSTVQRAAARVLAQRGFGPREMNGRQYGFTHSIGHGIGLALHEAPAMTSAATRVRTGNVITIEPGLAYPDIGDIRLEDTVVVMRGGWRYLVPCERRLEV